MNLTFFAKNQYIKTKITIILTLCSLLIFYHTTKVYDLYWQSQLSEYDLLTDIQSIIRIAIAVSLLFVALGQKNMLWGMWLSITALTITRYILLFNAAPLDTIAISDLLGILRGFIFPAIITLIYPLFGLDARQAIHNT